MSTPNLTLISATPSPFARMNRIALALKQIPFTLQNEIPWHKDTTATPTYNPLEKLPVLYSPDDHSFESVYDSAHIQEYVVQKYADHEPRLLTGDLDLDLKARQIQTLAEGVLDAFVLSFFEPARPEEKQSREWMERQGRKIDGGMRAFDRLDQSRKGEYLIGDGGTFTIADIAVVRAVGHIDFSGVRAEWREKDPSLKEWWEKMDTREEFASTRPVMFELNRDRVVA